MKNINQSVVDYDNIYRKQIKGHLHLWKGLKGLLYRDISTTKERLFKQYFKRNKLVYVIYSFASTSLILKTISATLYFLINYLFLTVNKNINDYVTMIQLPNEKIIFDKYIINKRAISQIKKSLLGLFDFSTIKFRFTKLIKLFRIFNHLIKNYDFYLVLRVAEYIAYYGRLYALLDKDNLKGILMFTDNNPNSFALMFIAQRFRIPLYFISHGEPLEPIYPLKCKAAYLLGLESLRRYESRGSKFNKIFFKGHKQSFKKFQPIIGNQELTLGLFLGKLSTLERLSSLLTSVSKQLNIGKILIRRHPITSFYKKTNIKHMLPKNLILLNSTTFEEDVKKCDLILSGNSTAQLEALHMGKAVLYSREMEEGNFDKYKYIKDGLLISWDTELTLEKINDFYSNDNRVKIKNRLDLSLTLSESIENFNRYVFGK